ncbi:TrlF family AAA-like ATPase [Reyranella sp.]|uniref:TrlF family AAA-like ATPase n=1 Tax=Reyranella sp. TaxID=1929291 RepID=UPI002731902E|nr:AAA family ATPase [Reyranella sp.]MDP2377624.1 AAA family ATPase [Reyranella sp.]
MNAGYAFWRKCDLQIHTPRDPNWSGPRPIGDGDDNPATSAKATPAEVESARAAWAVNFVDKCLAKGLEAIALTDHHEMTMVTYVQQEILKRKKKDSSFGLWLFPGMELTASGGVQCLILFDADLSEDWRRQAQSKIGIAFADLNEKKGFGPKVTQLKINYADIGNSLDELAGLQGRYIVLPNVSKGGQHTVLTSGGHGDFLRMPYVGGYLDRDQTIDTLGAKNKQRLSGKDKTWSTREVYPIPTSDSRSADYAHLGGQNTWIKLAAPTAEGLRQAFLGHRSRIRIDKPLVPTLAIDTVEIEGSSILQNTVLRMSPELNSAIGGRGSGKSSFLEYVAFGLGRSCYDVPRDHYSGTQRMHDLINDTLISKGGRVILTIIQDGAVFKVTRGVATGYQPQITYPNGTKQTVTAKELRALFPAVIYSQGELAEIGKQSGIKTQLADLLQFVNSDFKREDDKLTQDIETAKAATRTAVQNLATHWILRSQLLKLTTQRDSLKQRVEALEKTLPAQTEADQAILQEFEKANEFESKRLQASKHADQMVSELESVATELLNERELTTTLKGDAATFRIRYHDMYQAFASALNQLRKDMKSKRNSITATEGKWAATFKKTREARDGVLEKMGAHKTVTAQIIKLKEELTAIINQIADLEAKLKAQKDPATALTAAIAHLKKINADRAKRTQEWAKEIERLSSGKIKAAVTIAGDTSEIKEAIDVVAAKTGSQEAKRLSELEAALAGSDVWDVIDRVRTDCQLLLYWQLVGSSSGEKQPPCADLLKLLGNTDKIKTTLIERMDTSRVQAMATAVPKPEIVLTYTDGSKAISFDKASEGQRAAALLFMLLEQPGGPLIVDQPEGDLDNRIISDLTDQLHRAKQNRQILFASHNANIVVNGSSELVGHLDVKEDGERQFECAGAIDTPTICKIITSTMEGGEKAFKDRQNKYGY